jgi:3-deoxy-manno-octulosonate cytidylyltransferase (CMP-KDO synthetase)
MKNKPKILGFVPARMAASRFPGKPLHPIHGRPMVEHVFLRAQLFKGWDGLFLATCDREIEDIGRTKGWPVVMTSHKHLRCLDRVGEAAEKCGIDLDGDDIIVCVQGDEPMLHPEMIEATIKPLLEDARATSTVLAMEIADEDQFHNPNVVKIVANSQGEVLYSSRAAIPYCKGEFSLKHGARRIYGIFAFRWNFLKVFNAMPEGRLEVAESCDINRIFEGKDRQKISPYPYYPSYAVDCPADIKLVEESIVKDPVWGKY